MKWSKNAHQSRKEERSDMQILEYIAQKPTYTGSEFVSECYSVIGYLQCMDQFQSTDLMESVDIKNIFTKMINSIMSILTKFGKLIRDGIKFIGSKIKAFVKKNKSKSGSSGKSSSGKGKILNIGMKTDDELEMEEINSIFEQHKYTGINPAAITCTLNVLDEYIYYMVDRINDCTETIDNISNNIAVNHIAFGEYDFTSDVELIRYINELMVIVKDGIPGIVRQLVNAEYYRNLDTIKSPEDFKSIQTTMYNSYKVDGYSIGKGYKNEILTPISYNLLCGAAEEAMKRIDRTSESMQRHLEMLEARNNKCINNIKQLQSSVESSIADINPDEYKLLAVTTANVSLLMNTISRCVAYMNAGFSETYMQMEADLNHCFEYIRELNSAFDDIGIVGFVTN